MSWEAKAVELIVDKREVTSALTKARAWRKLSLEVVSLA